jgi:pimeloyl-ACP methyl ester carboxylesterase
MQPLVDALEGCGVIVYTPKLHRGSLAADTDAVQRVFDDCDAAPVVVAHSYGGAVAAGIDGAAAFVFMAAFVPRVGESCAQLGGVDAPVNAWVRPFAEGFTYIPEEVATGLFYGDCSPGAAQTARSLLVPQASGHGRGEVRSAGWRHMRSLYLVCANDRAMSPKLQQTMAERCTSSKTFDSGHSPYISRPRSVADAIMTFGASS